MRPPRAFEAIDGEHSPDPPVLIVESSPTAGQELVEQLCAEGYRTALASTPAHARALARNRLIRAVLLGVLEDARQAIELLREIRRSPPCSPVWDGALPAIVLSPGVDQLDLLRAFESGADDFIVHPAPALELRMRLAALLRRTERTICAQPWRVGPLAIDITTRLVRVGERGVELSPKEYELLVQLARHPARACSRGELLRHIWGVGGATRPRLVDRHASALRRKLDDAGASGLIVNVWGVGYRLT